METSQFESFRGGSISAFEFFYREHCDLVYLYLLNKTKDRDLAMDLCQETFNRLWDSREKMRDTEHIRRFVLFVAKNLFLKHLRKEQSLQRVEKEFAYVTREEVPGDPEGRGPVKKSLKQAMGGLSERRRKVVVLHYLHGFSVSRIASQWGLAEQTVRNTLSDAIRRLRDMML